MAKLFRALPLFVALFAVGALAQQLPGGPISVSAPPSNGSGGGGGGAYLALNGSNTNSADSAVAAPGPAWIFNTTTTYSGASEVVFEIDNNSSSLVQFLGGAPAIQFGASGFDRKVVGAYAIGGTNATTLSLGRTGQLVDVLGSGLVRTALGVGSSFTPTSTIHAKSASTTLIAAETTDASLSSGFVATNSSGNNFVAKTYSTGAAGTFLSQNLANSSIFATSGPARILFGSDSFGGGAPIYFGVNGVETFRLGLSTDDRATITAGTLATGKYALKVTGTTSTTNALQTGMLVDITPGTSSGASASQYAFYGYLGSGYTGTSETVGVRGGNVTSGTGTTPIGSGNFSGNFGLTGVVANSTVGYNVGLFGYSQGSSVSNIGIGGAARTDSATATNYGAAASAVNDGAGYKVGGYFYINTAAAQEPTTTRNVGLVASNGNLAENIFEARDGPSNSVFTIADGGTISNPAGGDLVVADNVSPSQNLTYSLGVTLKEFDILWTDDIQTAAAKGLDINAANVTMSTKTTSPYYIGAQNTTTSANVFFNDTDAASETVMVLGTHDAAASLTTGAVVLSLGSDCGTSGCNETSAYYMWFSDADGAGNAGLQHSTLQEETTVMNLGEAGPYVGTSPSTLPVCAAAYRGWVVYREDTDSTAAGSEGSLCLCRKDDSASTFSWESLNGGTC